MALSARTVGGGCLASRKATARPCSRKAVVVRAASSDRQQQQQEAVATRRAAIGSLAALAAVVSGSNAPPADAAYGEAANIFGKTTNTSGYLPYSGSGYALLLPSKWNPSKEKDFKNVDLRWEDNFDSLSHVVITKTKTDKSSIEQFGTPDAFFKSINSYLGEQSFIGETLSEGGFEPNKVASASLLDVGTVKDKNGKSYYKYELLTRAADGNEGGRHVLINAACGSGNLYIMKVQCGDKRWMKGAAKDAIGIFNSFTVA